MELVHLLIVTLHLLAPWTMTPLRYGYFPGGRSPGSELPSGAQFADCEDAIGVDMKQNYPSEIVEYNMVRYRVDALHPMLRFCNAPGISGFWERNATIQHSNMILFSFHRFPIPQDKRDITTWVSLL